MRRKTPDWTDDELTPVRHVPHSSVRDLRRVRGLLSDVQMEASSEWLRLPWNALQSCVRTLTGTPDLERWREHRPAFHVSHAVRHLGSSLYETTDPVTGESHLALAACRVLFALALEEERDQ